MKKIILLVTLITIFTVLNAQSNQVVKDYKLKFDEFYLSASPFVLPRLCVGVLSETKLPGDNYQELMIYLHGYDNFSTDKVYGLALRNNTFFSKDKRTGFYGIWNCGVDYIQNEFSFCGPGGCNGDDDEIPNTALFPSLAVGLGYSIPISEENFLRLECDLGIKWFLGNIYLSYVW